MPQVSIRIDELLPGGEACRLTPRCADKDKE